VSERSKSSRRLDPIYFATAIVVLVHVSFGGSRILISLYALALHASPFVIGLLISLYAVMPMFLSVQAGRVADRVGHRLPMLYGSIALVAALVIPAVWHGLPALFVSAALAGGSFSIFNVAAQALVGAMSTPEKRAFNFSTLSMGYSIASLVGPLVVGYAVDHVGARWAYAILALILVVPTLALLDRKRVPASLKPGSGETGKRSILDLLRNKSLLAIFLASGACVTGWDLFTFFMPIYGTRIGLSATMIGVIISAFGVATLVVRVFIPRLTKRYGDNLVLGWAMALGAVAFGSLPFFENVGFLIAAAFVMGLGLGCGQPLTMMICYNRSPTGRAGEANGVRTMANNLTHMVVPLVFGALGSAFGMGPVFWINSFVLLGGAYLGAKRF
jgi:MFS family permease